MTAAGPVAGAPRGFAYDRLTPASRSGYLTPRRLRTLLARHGVDPAGARIEIHPASGRNRLFTLETGDGREWLAKQSLTFPGAEAWFYANEARHHAAVPACLAADRAADVVVVELLRDAERLDRMARRDLRAVLERLPGLARTLAALHGAIGRRADAPAAQTPFPDLDPIDVRFWLDAGEGTRAVIAGLQANARLSAALRRAATHAGTPGLIHGDLKLDNLLALPGGSRLVDWECCGRGAVETDLGAVIGSLLIVWCDHWSGPLTAATAPDGATPISIDDLLAAAREFVAAYAAGRRGAVDREHLAACAAAWIAGRSWVESTIARGVPASHGLRTLIAEELIEHPELLAGAAS